MRYGGREAKLWSILSSCVGIGEGREDEEEGDRSRIEEMEWEGAAWTREARKSSKASGPRAYIVSRAESAQPKLDGWQAKVQIANKRP